MSPSPEDKLILCGERRLAIRQYQPRQKGEIPLILLHGAGRTLEDWAFVAPQLSEHRQVISVDFRNHGHSDDDDWTWSSVTGDIQTLLSELSLESYVVAGHSLGGMVASLLAHQDERCQAAINVDGFGRGRPELYHGIDIELATERLAQVEALTEKFLPAPGQRISAQELQTIATQFQSGDRAEWTVKALKRGLKTTPQGTYALHPCHEQYLQINEAIKSFHPLEVTAQTRCPLLIVQAVGSSDEQQAMLAQANARGMPWLEEMLLAYQKTLQLELSKLASKRDNIQYVAIDCGHGVTLERPGELASLINEFLVQLQSRQDEFSA